MINKDRIKQSFLELVAINSPSKRERAVADYLVGRLKKLGFSVDEDDAAAKIEGNSGNIIATLNGTVKSAKAIFLGGHMDTVESTENLKVVIDGDLIKSDGTTILGADDKGGIAAILEGVESIIESNTPFGNIQLVFNVAEEIGLLGSRNMDYSKFKADYGFVFDTQKPVCCITWSAPSHMNILVEITGRASHAGMAPEKGVSAILAASNAISKMTLGRIDFETTANVGVIQGGKARNIIPDKVIVKAEARSRDEGKLAAQVEHMKSTFEEEASKMGAEAVVKLENEYTAFRFGEDDDIVKLASKASQKIGIEPVYTDGGGGSDANVFNANGIPVLNIGVGYDGAHSSSENVTFSDLARCAEFVEALIVTVAQSHSS